MNFPDFFFECLFGWLIIFLILLIQWITSKERTVKGFLSGLVGFVGLFLFLIFSWLIESLDLSWICLPVVLIVGVFWLFICFAFWAWLERKIDPLRPQRERAKWDRIHREYMESERRYKELMEDCEKLAKEDAELDQETTDEELQRLININAADEGEPSGISPHRREKLIKDTERRIREWPPIKDEPAKASGQNAPARVDDSPLTDDEISLVEARASQDFIIEYLLSRRSALLRGASVEEIDALTEDWAQYQGIDVDALDEDWVGTQRLKIKQISRMKDGVEKDTVTAALAQEITLKQERQDATQPVPKYTHERNAENRQHHQARSLVVVCRWIMVLPVSFLAGIAGFCCLMLLNQISMSGWSEPGLPTGLFILLIPSGASGAAIVYVAFRLAPSRKSETMFLVCALVVLSCGFCIALAIADRFLPSIVTNGAAAIGACLATWRLISST